MSRDLVTLAEDDSLADARVCMQRGRIRHLPVVREAKLVGLLTHRDLLAASFSMFTQVSSRAERHLFEQIPVAEVMHDAYAVPPTMRYETQRGSCLIASTAVCQLSTTAVACWGSSPMLISSGWP